MKRRWALASFAASVLLALPSAAHAQDGDLPPPFDVDLARRFEAELFDILSDRGLADDVDATNLDALVGEPGDLELPAGESLILAAAREAVTLAPQVEGAGGSSLTGPCMGVALSFDGDGSLIDIAADFDEDAPPIDLLAFYTSDGTDVEAAFTSGNPYKVDVDGFVVYAGTAIDTTGTGPRNHTWEITTFGAALDSGSSANDAGENRNAGGVDLGDQLPAPAKVNALFKIDGTMTADNGFECAGDGYFETVGGAPIAQLAGGVLVLLGALGVFFNARPARTWKG